MPVQVFLPIPTAGQNYTNGMHTYKIKHVDPENVTMENSKDKTDEFKMDMATFRASRVFKLIRGGGKSKKRRKKNKRRTVRSGKIRNFFGF